MIDKLIGSNRKDNSLNYPYLSMSNEKADPYLSKKISLYKTVFEEGAGSEITIKDLFVNIKRNPEWEKLSKKVRAATDWAMSPKPKKPALTDYDAAKIRLPAVTVAGTFAEKAVATSLREWSGLMVIDLDHLDERVDELKAQLALDQYVYSVFYSAGGRGLCVLIKVEVARWREAFESIENYFLVTYGLSRKDKQFDSSGSNTNRVRFVSHDPYLVYNPGSKVFRAYIKKADVKKWVPNEDFIDSDRDIEFVLSQIEKNSIQFHDTGAEWVRMGLALASKYDIQGLTYFQRASQFRHDYDPEETAKRYIYFCRIKDGRVSISTFYYLAKLAGCEIMSDVTKKIVSTALMHKKQGATQAHAIKEICSMMPEISDAASVITQTFQAKGGIETNEHWSDQLKFYLRTNYPMVRNGVTRLFEDKEGIAINDEQLNSIYFEAEKQIDKLKFQDFDRMVNSEFITQYDPFTQFLNKYENLKPTGQLDKLASSLICSNLEPQKAYVKHFLKKWMLGIISSMLGEHTPLVYVLCGPMNIGKTRWFRGLLPTELSTYFGESELDKGQDDEILMTKKLILYNDEFGGMTRHDVKRFKNLTSKDIFSIREPYGRSHKDMRRIAVLCGSSNEEDLLNDPTGNRRIIPVHIVNVDWAIYDSVDKLQLLIEVYNLYKAGERHYLTKEDMKLLDENTERFQDLNIERELISQYYSVPDDVKGSETIYLSSTQIKVYLERVTGQRLGVKRIAQEMKRAGFLDENRKIQGKSIRGFAVLTTEQHTYNNINPYSSTLN